jgi:hypothetical protein
MPIIKCKLCGKTFKKKENLEYHENNAVCSGKDKKFKCNYCESKFSSKNARYRHMREVCKTKKQSDAERENMRNEMIKLKENFKKLEKKNSDLEKKNNDLEKKTNDLEKKYNKVKKHGTSNRSRITNNVMNNTTNNGIMNNSNNKVIINNIHLVGYGSEDMSKLSKEEFIKILQNGYNSTIKMTEVLHFNPKLPENHNVYIPSMKDKYAMMYDGNDWTLTDRNDLLDRIYDDKKSYIEENIDEFVNSLSTSRKNALKRWLDTNDEDKKIADVKERMKLLLYNKRKIPINTRAPNKRKSSGIKKIPKDLPEQIQNPNENEEIITSETSDDSDSITESKPTPKIASKLNKSKPTKSNDIPTNKRFLVVRKIKKE